MTKGPWYMLRNKYLLAECGQVGAAVGFVCRAPILALELPG